MMLSLSLPGSIHSRLPRDVSSGGAFEIAPASLSPTSLRRRVILHHLGTVTDRYKNRKWDKRHR